MENHSDKTVLKVNALSKSFKNIHAVRDISFSLEQGDIFAFLGPNGAGKTTTLRILLDIITQDSGLIEWNLNNAVLTRPEAGSIGYLPEERGLYLDIPIIRSLIYLATIRGMEPSAAKTAANNWLERLGLADRAKEKLQALSKGNQQKIQFISAILHKPTFVILDEPFSGFDPLNQELFIDYIKEINKQGTTILLSAHQMSLVEKIASKVFLINNGQEVYNGSLSGIYDTFGKMNVIDLTFKSPVLEEVFQTCAGIENIMNVDDCQFKLTFRQETELSVALSQLARIEGITSIASHKPDLHDMFLQLVKTHGK